MRTYNSSTTGLILNSRPPGYQERFHETFGELPWAIYDCPLIQAMPVNTQIPAPTAFDAIIFTSQIGVGMFFGGPAWQEKKVYAVGAATAEAARQAGYKNVVQTGVNVDDLRGYLAAATFRAAFYPSARDVSVDLPVFFPGRMERVVVYEMNARESLPQQFLQPALHGTPVVAPLFSRRATDIFADLLHKSNVTAANTNIIAVGMSADVFGGKDGPWQRYAVAATPTLNALAERTGEIIESVK